MLKRVDVYLRDDKAYVAPIEGGEGLSWLIEPVFAISDNEQALAEALEAALAVAPTRPPSPFPEIKNLPTGAGKKLLQLSGLKPRPFYSKAKKFQVRVDDAGVLITRSITDSKRLGFEGDKDWSARFPANVSHRQMARAIIEAAPTTLLK
jgi:hypothetical protein